MNLLPYKRRAQMAFYRNNAHPNTSHYQFTKVLNVLDTDTMQPRALTAAEENVLKLNYTVMTGAGSHTTVQDLVALLQFVSQQYMNAAFVSMLTITDYDNNGEPELCRFDFHPALTTQLYERGQLIKFYNSGHVFAVKETHLDHLIAEVIHFDGALTGGAPNDFIHLLQAPLSDIEVNGKGFDFKVLGKKFNVTNYTTLQYDVTSIQELKIVNEIDFITQYISCGLGNKRWLPARGNYCLLWGIDSFTSVGWLVSNALGHFETATYAPRASIVNNLDYRNHYTFYREYDRFNVPTITVYSPEQGFTVNAASSNNDVVNIDNTRMSPLTNYYAANTNNQFWQNSGGYIPIHHDYTTKIPVYWTRISFYMPNYNNMAYHSPIEYGITTTCVVASQYWVKVMESANKTDKWGYPEMIVMLPAGHVNTNGIIWGNPATTTDYIAQIRSPMYCFRLGTHTHD